MHTALTKLNIAAASVTASTGFALGQHARHAGRRHLVDGGFVQKTVGAVIGIDVRENDTKSARPIMRLGRGLLSTVLAANVLDVELTTPAFSILTTSIQAKSYALNTETIQRLFAWRCGNVRLETYRYFVLIATVSKLGKTAKSEKAYAQPDMFIEPPKPAKQEALL